MWPIVTDGVAWSVCRSVTIMNPAKTWTNQDNIWVELWTRMGPKEACVRWGCTLAQPGEYDWTVHVWRRCGLFVKLLWPLILFACNDTCIVL